MIVFVTRRLALDPVAIAPPGIDVVVSPLDRPLSRDEIVDAAAEASGIVSMLSDPFDADLIAALPRLRVIANHAVGVNNVDLAAATARGIAVCNTPDVLTDATADLTMALILAVTRRLREAERHLRQGEFTGWAPTLLLGGDLAGSTLGLFGFGRIGRAVARRAAAFGMRVLFHSRRPIGADGEREADRRVGEPAAIRVSWDDLLGSSDIVSIHAPLTVETRHAFDARALASMKRGAILINTARGPIVDEGALVDALQYGPLGGAGLDVFEEEPRVHPGLCGRDDVVLLPHVGSATYNTRVAMARLALGGCFEVLLGRTPANRVA